MVCAKCEEKLARLATGTAAGSAAERKRGVAAVPAAGRINTAVAAAAGSTSSGGRLVNENKLLSARARASPYGGGSGSKAAAGGAPAVCGPCGGRLLTPGAKLCQTCAFKRGLCSQCGRVMLDVSAYKQKNV